MTDRENICEDVWQYLPVRKYLLGRDGVSRIVEQIVAEWQPSRLLPSGNLVEPSDVAAIISDRVSRQYGVIWLWVFQALITVAIQYLVDLWFRSVVVRTVIVDWHGELADEQR